TSAAALGDVGSHDDGHDASVGLTHAAPLWRHGTSNRAGISNTADLCAGCRLPHGLDPVQPGSNGASARARGVVAGFADDAINKSRRRCHTTRHRRLVSVDAHEVRLSPHLPFASWISDEPMAQRNVWRVYYGPREWR